MLKLNFDFVIYQNLPLEFGFSPGLWKAEKPNNYINMISVISEPRYDQWSGDWANTISNEVYNVSNVSKMSH